MGRARVRRGGRHGDGRGGTGTSLERRRPLLAHGRIGQAEVGLASGRGCGSCGVALVVVEGVRMACPPKSRTRPTTGLRFQPDIVITGFRSSTTELLPPASPQHPPQTLTVTPCTMPKDSTKLSKKDKAPKVKATTAEGAAKPAAAPAPAASSSALAGAASVASGKTDKKASKKDKKSKADKTPAAGSSSTGVVPGGVVDQELDDLFKTSVSSPPFSPVHLAQLPFTFSAGSQACQHS